MYIVSRAPRVLVAAIFTVFALAAAGMIAANAQPTRQPATTIPNVSAFLANPGQLLQQYPNGGPPLANAVQQLALADPSTFKVLLGLLASANDLQKSGLGAGLAQAAKIEVLTNQPLAADWQLQIAAILDPPFKTAATNAFGDVELGSVGGGALGGTGDGGGTIANNQGSQSPGPLQNLQSTPTSTQAFSFSAPLGNASNVGASVSP